jgi:hypothetical protein
MTISREIGILLESRTERMLDDTDDFRVSPRSDLAINALRQVQGTGNQLPPPTFIAYAVLPKGRSGEGRYRFNRVADETASSVCVHGQQKGDEEVVCIPKGLERLSPDLGMSGGVHEEHAEEHDISGNAARLSIENLNGGLGPDLRPLNIEEASHV